MEGLMMKKHEFYTMVRKNGKVVAELQKGYTDGTYHYYKKDYTWFAIYPDNGLSICAEDTRKAAAASAHNPKFKDMIAEAIKRQAVTAERFAALVEKAKKGTA